ncbi:MAG: response regulator [Candidatus Margulisbacteria bacterium]|nr:response regulator [Candidatus Margulisiibacteriota bacterium]MBU1022260.1 response regulator [Candidatus Margulisiibacteriota bacterium]MBU1729301.1 response regulator [Candidatus Margulisiibacteriota bacterium]MBU1767995.1 response regulator [Candidatus Omnitrophota bacterium]MBU1955574.1 response regulator [Candidatus Margulisiibacteriota bacterium]
MSEKKPHILVIEDDPDMVEAIKIRFEANNFDVSVALDGIEGLSKARTKNPDLIILDIMLPKLDGFKLCRMLKYDEKYKSIPIIMLTAKIQKSDVSRGKEVGADAYITKPFKSEELIEKVKEFLAKPA